MKIIALKVDVDTLRGTREGVPQLIKLFQKHSANATFLFSLGPDHTGWAMKRIFRPGFFSKVKRTSVLSHYGIKTLLYGTLLPGPHIGKKAADVLKQTQKAGFEVGIHTYDHVYWQDNVFRKDQTWTSRQMELARKTFKDVFGEEPRTHGAAGWQMNDYAFDWLSRFSYASDTRGEFPFYPKVQNKISSCLQMPTTLPTMDEVLGLDSITEANIAEYFLKLTEKEKEFGHVFTLHAELEGMKLIPVMEKFIIGLKAQGYKLVSMADLFQQIQNQKFPICQLDYSAVPGRSGNLWRQGPVVTA